MPEPQSDAVVEIVNEAMNDLVTKEYFTAELDRRFGKVESDMDKRFGKVDKRFAKVEKRIAKLESKVDTGFAGMREDMAKSHKSVVTSMVVLTVSIIAALLTALGIVLAPLPGGGAEAEVEAIIAPREQAAPPAAEPEKEA